MTRIAIFAGPSVPPESRNIWPGVTWLPPAQAGDFLKLLGEGFDAIALIDGYFDHCPASWHKEILVAMAEGISVVGASSMGALRAAELDNYGMIGVGAIYQAYRRGLLTGDDEVALVHAPERLGWKPLSVPMVEVRATLLLALRHGLLDRENARRLRDTAHDIHFMDRDWPRLARLWLDVGIGEERVDWVVRHHVELKRMDAMACIHLVVSGRIASPAIPHVPQTVFLNQLQSAVSASAFSAREKSVSPAPSLNG